MATTREWTLMFYFASDNPLAPGIISQLKSLKNAGYHPEANVIAHFDPRTQGTPTHIFDVNAINKIKSHGQSNIGFRGDDPFVRDLMEDKLWRDQKNRDGKLIKQLLKQFLNENGHEYDPPYPPEWASKEEHPTEPSPKDSLWEFLKFCAHNYPARRYMLFILGHGLIVANDVFLYDEHADEHSLSLKELGKVLAKFKREIKEEAEFDLVSFHSCSVSSLEVAYELEGTANFMLASQGPAFVGSYPYRQILIRIFNDLKGPRNKINVKEMLKKIFWYCLYNSTDFMLAGYSFDLCLCNLNKVGDVKDGIKQLSRALLSGLNNPVLKNLILLSHWKAQSYWAESYTDLYDFCFCLCYEICEHLKIAEPNDATAKLKEACKKVMSELARETRPKKGEKLEEKLILHAEFAGPAYQYSHGLSVFFPWSQPISDIPIMEEYRRYKFAQQSSWLTFLEMYLEMTLRETRKTEMAEGKKGKENPCLVAEESPKEPETSDGVPETSNGVNEDELFEDIASLMFDPLGALSRHAELPDPPEKTDPTDPTGDSSYYPSIKNYPHDTRARRVRETQADGMPVSAGLLKRLER